MRGFAKRFISSASLHILFGLALGQGAIFLLTPLLTRLYSPAEMGLAGTFLAAASIVGTVATVRFELLIPSANAAESSWLVRIATRSIIVTSVLSAVVFTFVSGQSIVEALLFGLTVGGLGGVALALQLAARRQRLSGVALSKAGQGLGQVGVQVVAALVGATRFGMQLGYAIGYLFSAGIQIITLGASAKDRGTATSPLRPGVKSHYWRQSLILVVAAFLNISTVWMYPLLTQYLFGSVPTGHLSVAQRFAIAPASLVVASISPVIVAAVGARIRAGEPVAPIVSQWLKRLAPLGAIVLLVLLLVPRSWIVALLGADWGSVQSYLAAMSPMVATQLVVGPLSLILVLKGRSKLQLVWDLARLVVLGTVTLVVAGVTNDPVAMIWSASGVMTIFYAVYIVFVLRTRTVQTKRADLQPLGES